MRAPDLSVEARKHDAGKDPWHLLPWDAVRQVVAVLRFGAGKYGERNWESGIRYSRCYSALQRHMTAWWEGESKDPETGLSHLAHAGCCVVFLLAFEVRGLRALDDRPGRAAELEKIEREVRQKFGGAPELTERGVR